MNITKSLVINSFDNVDPAGDNAQCKFVLREKIQGPIKLEAFSCWNTMNTIDAASVDMWIEMQCTALSPTLYKTSLSQWPLYYPRNVSWSGFLSLIQDFLNSIIPGWPANGFVITYNELNSTVTIQNTTGYSLEYFGDTTTAIPSKDYQLLSHYLGFPEGIAFTPVIAGQYLTSLQITYFTPLLAFDIVIDEFEAVNSSNSRLPQTFKVLNVVAPQSQVTYESFEFLNVSNCQTAVNVLHISFRDPQTGAVFKNFSNWMMKMTYTTKY